jgi:hydroxycarboxylate dehydrogenase B
MFSMLVDPAALGSTSAFESEADAFLQWVQQSPVREGFGPVQVAGDAERASRAKRTAEGVPVDGTTWQEILDAAASLGVDPAAVNTAAGVA